MKAGTPGKTGLPTFDDVPAHEWKRMERLVARAKGRLVVLVHPYYLYEGRSEDGRKSQFAYYRTLGSLLRNKSTPVVILEEQARLASRQHVYGRIAGASGALAPLVLPTFDASPLVVHRDRIPDVGEDGHHAHRRLFEKLQAIGAKTILVGGMYADWHHDDAVADYEGAWLAGNRAIPKSSGEPFTAACAGNVYKNLIASRKFPTVRWMPNAMLDYYNLPGTLPHFKRNSWRNNPEAIAKLRAERKKIDAMPEDKRQQAARVAIGRIAKRG